MRFRIRLTPGVTPSFGGRRRPSLSIWEGIFGISTPLGRQRRRSRR